MASKGRLVTQIWKAFRELNPGNLEKEAARSVRIGVVAPSNTIEEVTQFLLGPDPEAYDAAADSLLLVTTPPETAAFSLLPKCDLILVTEGEAASLPQIARARVFTFTSKQELPDTIRRVLRSNDLRYAHLPLARIFPAFRTEVVIHTIQTVSVENAIFVASTSLGNIIPNPLQPLTSVAEALGDLVVLTANQLRMMFRIAAAFGRDIGLKAQAPEALSIVGAAFGWRSVARELVAKVPYGGGVVPKAAIAFAGTWAIGESIAFYYTTGRKLTKEEVKARFEATMDKGRATAEQIVGKLKPAEDVVARLRDLLAQGKSRFRGGTGGP